jgi:uncharacterized protein YbaR (Trm112 family)
MSGFSPSTIAAFGATSEPLLIAVVGLLALVIVGLAAMALILRRRSRNLAAQTLPPAEPKPTPVPAPMMPRPRPRPAMVRGGGGGGLAIATSSAMVCPTCRTEYHGLTYCTRDARRLVPPEEMITTAAMGPVKSGRSAGLVCMACRRAYEPGLRSCPHDGNELVPFPVYNATRPRKRGTTEPAGVIARICPVCATKYDLNARFCGHDAGELVVIN